MYKTCTWKDKILIFSMKKFIFSLILSLLISFSAFAKNIEQKKDELQKIYEAGGISKIEHEKALKFLEKSTEDKKKRKRRRKNNHFH